MKKRIFVVLAVVSLLGLVSCNDWLLEVPDGTNRYEDYYVSGETCYPVVNACYVPMMWELGTTYMNEWFIGDIASDDAIKGGENRIDMPMALDIELFQVNAENTLLLDFYRAQYIGISRCNRAIQDIAKVPTDEFMNETIYQGIVQDLKDAEAALWKKSEYAAEDLGKATKGSAQALLMKVYLTGREYLGGGAAAFAEAVKWGEALELSGEYDLCPVYWDNFSLAGENGIESVFEIQYTNDATSSYGEGGFGYTRGTMTVILQRARARAAVGNQEGWGYNRPSGDLVNEYETGDPRKDVTIGRLKEEELSNKPTEVYEDKIWTINRKYAMLTDGAAGVPYTLSHHTRGPINHKEIRYADALLMYAEACVETGNTTKAKALLNRVRERARGANPATVLPAFPYGSYTESAGDLRKAIRHERRVELAMEGHRWFDITRWYPLDGSGNEVMNTSPDPEKKYVRAASVLMNAYRETAEIRDLYPDMGQFRDGIHEIFPIPAEERRLAGLDQNYGY